MSFWKRRNRDDELDDEIRSHLRMAARDREARGEGAQAAEQDARRELGNVALIKEVTREMWGWRWAEQARQDARYAWRTIRKNPGFAAVAIGTIALGIGMNTAVFSLMDAVLLARDPYPNVSRLVVLHQSQPELGEISLGASTAELFDYKNRNRTCRYLAGYEEDDYDLTGGREPERITGVRVTSDLFGTLGVWPSLGRAFTASEDVYGAPKLAVLSYGFWQSRFGGTPDVLGHSLRLNEREYTIIGVMPQNFEFPATRTGLQAAPALWVPMQFSPDELRDRAGSYDVNVAGLLKDGVSLAKSRQDMRRIVGEFERENPDIYTGNVKTQVRVDALGAEEFARKKPGLLILSAAVGLVLLIACANVANLLLARVGSRQREIAVRSALGASGLRLIQQILSESVALSLSGAVLGCGLAQLLIRLAAKFGPQEPAELQSMHLNWRVLAVALAVSIVTGIACGLVPTAEWRARSEGDALKQSGRSVTDSRTSRKIKNFLVVIEAALAIMLLIGAGLLIRSFETILRVPPGFDPHGLVIVRTSFNRQRYSTPERRHSAERLIMERLRAMPGVETAALTTHIPFADERGIGFVVEGGNPNEFHWADNALVDGSYFETMKIPLLRGRTFGLQDTPQAPDAAVINLAMAQRFWPKADPVGKGLFWGGRHLRIVGVAGNVQIKSLDANPGPMIYNSVYQIESGASSSAVFVVRTARDLRRVAEGARRVVWSVDSGLPVFGAGSMEAVVKRSLAERRFTMLLLGTFAVVALGLSLIGLYGVLSYAVMQRTTELGMRLALGAEPRKLIWLVMSDGVRLTLAGIALGTVGGGVLALAMSKLLFGIRSLDSASSLGAAAALLLTALLASFVPALRPARVDPITALRASRGFPYESLAEA